MAQPLPVARLNVYIYIYITKCNNTYETCRLEVTELLAIIQTMMFISVRFYFLLVFLLGFNNNQRVN